jgi:hypothetical protein
MRRSFPTSFSGLLGKLFAFLLWKRWRASTSAFRAPKLSGFYSCWVFALLFGCTGPTLDLPRGDVHDRLSRLGEIPRALGAASLGSTALIVPSLEGLLAGVMLVVFRALVRHVSEYAPSDLGRKPENGLPCSNRPTTQSWPALT